MKSFKIANRAVGGENPCYVIAEVSCNHEGDYDEAVRIVEAAAAAGADAVKIQTYTATTMTTNSKNRAKDTMWEDIDLFELYEKAHTPWNWYGKLRLVAEGLGMHLFSTPFDETAVDYLESEGSPVYKIASFEVVDTKLLEKVASTGKPVIISNGMTNYHELDEAVRILKANGADDIAILHCNSGYPAAFDEANIKTIPFLSKMFDVVSGLSDHTIYADDKNFLRPMAHVTPFEGVKMGAKIIEVHLTLDREKARALNERNEGGFDWSFSREPAELKKMIDMIRTYEREGKSTYNNPEENSEALRTHGVICLDPTEKELASRQLRPSLWIVKDIEEGGVITFGPGGTGNVDSLRPGGGLHIRYADIINGARATKRLEAGTPLRWDMVDLA